MADRRWTVMVVPHGSDSPRSFSISERAVRAGAYVGSALALMAVVGLGSAIASDRPNHFVGNSSERSERDEPSQPRDVAEVARRVASLRDTLNVIRKREANIRLLAGLPATDSAGPGPFAQASDEQRAGSDRRGRRDADPARRSPVRAIRRRERFARAERAAVRERAVDHADRGVVDESIHAHAEAPAAPRDSAARRDRRRRANGCADHRAGVRYGDEGRSGERLRQRARDRSRQRDRYSLCTLLAHRRAPRPARDARSTHCRCRKHRVVDGAAFHYEIHINGKVVDPLTYVLADAIPD